MTVEDERTWKVEELRQYLEKRFPGATVQVAPLDEHLRYRFYIDYPDDAARSRQLTLPLAPSRQLTLPLAAVDDLDPSEVTALLDHPATEPLWQKLFASPLHLQYDPPLGLTLPKH